MWKSEQQLLTLKYNIFRSFVPPEKYSYANLVNDEKKSTSTCQHCDGCVKCSGKSVAIIHINFPHAGMTGLGLYTEGLDPDIFSLSGLTGLK